MQKIITCPEHKHHEATLHTRGSEYAGIWECEIDGTSDTCEHLNTHHEEVEIDTMRNGEHDTYKSLIEVCDECEETVGL